MKTFELQFTKDFRGQFKAHFSQPDTMSLLLSTAPKDPPLLSVTPSAPLPLMATSTPLTPFPMTVSLVADLRAFGPEAQEHLRKQYHQWLTSPDTLSVTGTFQDVEAFYQDLCRFDSQSQKPLGGAGGPGGGAPAVGLVNGSPGTGLEGGARQMDSVTLPAVQYDYISKAYWRELEQIKKDNRVEMNAMVSVSFQAGKEGQATVERAQMEFTKMVQDAAFNIEAVQITEESLDPGRLEQLLVETRRQEARQVLTATSVGCQLFRPKDSLAQSREGLRIRSKLEMSCQDPLVEEGLEMEETYWTFLEHVHRKQLDAMQKKFGVVLKGEKTMPSVGRVRVRVLPGQEGGVPLQCQALTALLQLYQKAATGILSCAPMDPKQTESVKEMFYQIHKRHPNVATGEKYGGWKLIGLPEHLGPVVYEVEQKLGWPAFKGEERLRRRWGGPSLEKEEQEGARGGHGAEGETHNPEDRCPICLDAFQKKMALQCKHEFCEGCLKEAVRVSGAVCPVCKDVFGKVEGNQPPGRMRHTKSATSLPGFPHCGSICIDYEIPNGIQTDKHPKPGRRFIGTSRTAYLPDSPEGNEVLGLLQKAFDQNLIFTVGTSRTTGSEDTVTWNDIHHKTNMHGGPQSFGYPDPDYLKRVKEELKAKGIK
ncbi:E3 ubiquitin-protein ligase DTX3L isoform X2 [Amia ocellicauda]